MERIHQRLPQLKTRADALRKPRVTEITAPTRGAQRKKLEKRACPSKPFTSRCRGQSRIDGERSHGSVLHLGPPFRGGIPSRKMPVKYPKQLLLPFTGTRSMRHGLRGRMNSKSAQRLGTNRTGPSAPRRSHKSQSAEYQRVGSKPPEARAALRRKTGEGMAIKF